MRAGVRQAWALKINVLLTTPIGHSKHHNKGALCDRSSNERTREKREYRTSATCSHCDGGAVEQIVVSHENRLDSIADLRVIHSISIYLD
jgi:hypothetical protein